MKLVYCAGAGAGDRTRASIPLHLAANGSLEVGHETSLVLGGDATEVLLGRWATPPDVATLFAERDRVVAF